MTNALQNTALNCEHPSSIIPQLLKRNMSYTVALLHNLSTGEYPWFNLKRYHHCMKYRTHDAYRNVFTLTPVNNRPIGIMYGICVNAVRWQLNKHVSATFISNLEHFYRNKYSIPYTFTLSWLSGICMEYGFCFTTELTAK